MKEYILALPAILLADLRAVFTPRARLSRTSRNLCLLFALVAMTLGYTYLEATEVDSNVFPSWGELYEGTRLIIYNPFLQEYPLWEDSFASFERLLSAVALAGIVGTVLGLYMGVYAAAESTFARVLEFIGNVPPSAVLIVFISKFQFGLATYVGILVFGTITSITTTVFSCVQTVHDEEIYTLRTLGASRQEMVWSVLFWQRLPDILEAIRQTFAPAIVYLLMAEWQASSDGWGWRLMMLTRGVQWHQIFPYLVFFGLLAILVKIGFRILTNRLSPWHRLREDLR